MKSLSLILPCYNEAPSLEALVERVVRAAQARKFSPAEFELILVNNGSTDESKSVLQELCRSSLGPYLRVVTIAKNLGYGDGIYQGLKAASQAILAWTHADEQCDPEDVFTAWELVAKSSDPLLVKGSRRGRQWSLWLTSRSMDVIATGLLGKRFHEINGQPKVFPVSLRQYLTNPPPGFAFDLYVLTRAMESGYSVQDIPVFFPPRKHGESRWATSWRARVRMIRYMIRFMCESRLEARKAVFMQKRKVRG